MLITPVPASQERPWKMDTFYDFLQRQETVVPNDAIWNARVIATTKTLYGLVIWAKYYIGCNSLKTICSKVKII
jgi:hypothetical protein